MTIEERIVGRKIGIIGMGRSGIAAALLGERLGGEVFVSDAAPAEKLTNQLETLSSNRIEFETEGHTDRLLGSDFIVLSPGVPPHLEILRQLEGQGVPIFSEIEFASWVCEGRIVAVTGSNGKTTTTTLIGQILNDAGLDAFACGNIGRPFAEISDHVGSKGVAVVEVSTFQLERIDLFRPNVSLILNLSPDHLDRHGTFDAYKALKYRIAENQGEGDQFIVNLQDPILTSDDIPTRAQRLFFTTNDEEAASFVREDWLWVANGAGPSRVIHVDDIGIRGPHNLQNCAAAVVAASLMGVPPNVMNDTLRSFKGVEHRLEKVDRVAGIDFVNDSKATNVDAVCFALQSIETPLYLIGGGRDKGGKFEELIQYGKGKVKGVILIGEARDKMFEALGQEFSAEFAGSLEEAVRMGFEKAEPGETVLLSPGCASFDMFDDYEHRGRVFKKAVAGLRNGKQSEEVRK